ncbi:Coatomer subunit beta [Cichlidogyrus casuarinus]|uniref:Coatomer subunit beta n=1 Tax=Cichlidogyrus casuarinus TaxID=1844966 RepID=A0ABD2PZA1_9PLAT
MLASVDVERKSTMQTRRSGHTAQKLTQERERNRPDAPVKFNLLAGGAGRTAGDQLVDMFDFTLSQALGGVQLGPDGKPVGDAYATSKLSKVHQLTGFSDPVYAEAYVNVNQFDIVLDILIVNQTEDTLQNVNLELSTMGDLKLVEQPPPITLAPSDFTNIKANIKVSR